MSAESSTELNQSNITKEHDELKWYRKPTTTFVSRLISRDVPLIAFGISTIAANLLARNTAAKLQQGAELAQNTSLEIIKLVTEQVMDPANFVSIVAGAAMTGYGVIFGAADSMRYGSEREKLQQQPYQSHQPTIRV